MLSTQHYGQQDGNYQEFKTEKRREVKNNHKNRSYLSKQILKKKKNQITKSFKICLHYYIESKKKKKKRKTRMNKQIKKKQNQTYKY